MQRLHSGQRRYSASDLVNFAACRHLTYLDGFNLETPIPKAPDTEETKLLQAKGFEHEARYRDQLERELGQITDLSSVTDSDEKVAATLEAMLRGDPAIFQATFLSGDWIGHADFLIRVDSPSKLGDFSYEIIDTKLARTSRAKFLVQLILYCEMLAEVQGVLPEGTHVVLGTGKRETFVVSHYLRYVRRLKARFLKWVSLPSQSLAPQSYPERCDRCPQCHWRDQCDQQWTADDHLNQVAGITRVQIKKLNGAGIQTMRALASVRTNVAPSPRIANIQPETLARLAHQAHLQDQSRLSGSAIYEPIDHPPGKGFDRLPISHPGDLFFDMEGDPLTEGGLEYLFGLYWIEGEGSGRREVFKPFWAHTRREERQAFEGFIDFVTAHLARNPEAHLYHYAPYEKTALKNLMLSHGTRSFEVDELLRHQKLVDLYAVVREAVRVGEPSYSIKAIERFYRAARTGAVQNAGASVVFYERWKTTGDPADLKAIEDYNRDDVQSTYELREWLNSIRPYTMSAASNGLDPSTMHADAGLPLGEGAVKTPNQQSLRREERTRQFEARLVANLPEDRSRWTDDHRVSELLFQLLDFHQRTNKPEWWSFFDREDSTDEELLDDTEALAALEQIKPPEGMGRRYRHFYRFPPQDCKLKNDAAAVLIGGTGSVSNLVINEDSGEVTFDYPEGTLPREGVAIGAGKPRNQDTIEKAIERIVEAYLHNRGGSSIARYQAGLSFLQRALPRVKGVSAGEALVAPGEDLVEASKRCVANLENSYIFIQGPPGAGKTYTGSHVIVSLLAAGKRVAVTSNSHKAIANLLEAVVRVADQQGVEIRGAIRNETDSPELPANKFKRYSNTQQIVREVHGLNLVGGTAWLASTEGLDSAFDTLFCDEAGQVSLANLLAMSTCARNLVLLGDQMQLGQPIKGVHPGESGASSLDYLLQGETTVAPGRGIFLKDTWRMHPDLCAFISDAVYSGRLEAHKDNQRQKLVLKASSGFDLSRSIKETGLSFIPVDHDGCSQRSHEEAQVIASIFNNLLRQQHVDRDGNCRPVTLEDILVVAPYNLQVQNLARVLPPGARVGTVDKFQGQEAAVALVSMTTSSGEYMPRNIEFLYSRNRLNVAISRAKCWAAVIASPKLLDIDVSTPQEMGLVNMLTWVAESGSY